MQPPIPIRLAAVQDTPDDDASLVLPHTAQRSHAARVLERLLLQKFDPSEACTRPRCLPPKMTLLCHLPVCSFAIAQWSFQHILELSGSALGTTLGRARSLRWLLVPAGSLPRRQRAVHPTLTQSVRLRRSETRASPAGIPKEALMRSSGTVSMRLQAAGPVADQPHRIVPVLLQR
jgi:hypothetical protein